MVEVDGKKARQINAQDPAHRRAYTWVNAQRSQCKESKERSGGKERKKFFSSPREGNRTHDPHLKRQGSSMFSNIYTAQISLALDEYHEGYGMSVCLFYQSVRPSRKADPLEQINRQTNYSKITRDSTKLSK